MARSAIVWGAAGGIGRALVESLIAGGWDAFGVARDAAALRGVTARAYGADVADPAAVQAVADEIGRQAPGAALWVYAVGDIAAGNVGRLSPEVWERILAANLNGAFYSARFSLPYLAPDAHLFFIGAQSERLHVAGLSAYASAKAGIEAFVSVLQREEHGRKVTLVRPRAVLTPLWKKAPFRPPSDAIQPAEVARAIVEAYEQGTTGPLNL